MQIRLHKQATTTPKVRAAIQASDEPARVLALLIPLGDLLAVIREFLNPNVSRSGLDRCLRRHGVGNLRDLKVKTSRPKHTALNSKHRLTPPKSPQTNGMVGSRRCCKATTSDQVRSWRRRCTAMYGSITRNFHNQPWAARRPCRR